MGGGPGELEAQGSQALALTHRPPGVQGRAHFFGVESDLQRQSRLGTHVGQPRAPV